MHEQEDTLLKISNLSDDATIEYYSKTVIRDEKTNRKSGCVSTLAYLFEFLDSYDFGSSGSDDIFSSHNKTLINASVLGLIFEKINGYKDGSFYTPSFITMYMARESLQKSILDKFNQVFEDLGVNSWNELVRYSNKHSHKDEFINNANSIIDSITICDPAVGSGHFLVSALNEIIYIKHQLGLYAIRGLDIKLENDELIVSLYDEWFNYIKPKSFDNDNHKVQKLLFTEKQRIIENQLFGVDINPNSAQITKLRLWIELLKNSYYDENYQLVTLPNIDINIKTGNSLISRFGLSDNLGKNIKNEVEQYKSWVELYKETSDKDIKHNVLESISELKKSYSTRLHEESPKIIKLKGLVDKYIAEFGFDGINDDIILYAKKEYIFLYSKDPTFKPQGLMGEHVSKLDKNKLHKEMKSLYDDVDSINKGKIYENAFEWRFEFPEVLDENGEFVGFDIVIGNPPYIKEYEGKHIFDGLRENEVYQGKMDIWYMFVADGLKILNKHGALNFIAPNNWTTNSGASKTRDYILENSKILQLIDFNNYMVFEEASIQTMIMQFEKQKADNYTFDYRKIKTQKPIFEDVVNLLNSIEMENIEILKPQVSIKNHLNKTLTFNNNINDILLTKIKEKQNFYLDEKQEVAQGIVFPQDFVNKASNEKLLNSLKIGEGIFALSEAEKNNLNLTEKELELIKPYFTSEQFSRYYANPNNNLWIIYTSSKFRNTDAILPYPNIKNHLDKFYDVITSDNKPYGLHRAREENFFKGEKIIVQRKCAGKPVFTYADFDTYVSATFYVIKTSRLNKKYLVALLNSKLIEFWLKNKGKMQGNNYQLDKEPLLNIPIYQTKDIKSFVELVDQILEAKKDGKDTAEFEAQIDAMVYKLYGLTEDEIAIVKKI